MRKPIIRIVILIAILMAGLAAMLLGDYYRNANKTGPLSKQQEGIDLRGQLVSIGLKQARQVVRVTFPGTTVSETLVQNRAYVIIVPDDPAVPSLTLDRVVLLSGDGTQPVNYFGYKYTSADGATEAANRNDPSFLIRFPGQFFASAQARAEDAQYGNIISQFEQSHGITMGSTGVGGVGLERNSRYIVIVNESQPVTFNIRRPVICGDGLKEGTEACDDNNFTLGDGCSSTCTVESGWTCSGTNPSTCETTCGDGLKIGTEACDDYNLTPGDGCSSTCTVESGWTCTGTNPSTCTQNPAADLGISTYFDPVTEERGNTTVLRISVTNNGPSAASNTVVLFPAPTGFTFLRWDFPMGVSCSGDNCYFGTMSSGQTKSFTYTYRINTVSPCSASASLTATASVSSDMPDSNSSNNQSSATVTATCPPSAPSADLSTTVSANPTTALQGTDVAISIDVLNNGPSTAVNPYFYLDVGGNTEMNNLRIVTGCVSFDTTNSGLKCYLGNIVAGERQVVDILATLTPHSPCTPGSTSSRYVNIYPGSDTPEGDTTNDHSSVTVTATCPIPNPDLAVTASASPSSVVRGNNTVLTFRVTNTGQANAVNARLNFPVPSSLTYVSYTAQPLANCVMSAQFTCTFGDFPPGSSRDVYVTLLASIISPCASPQVITPSVSVATDSAESSTGNNDATTTVTATATCQVDNFSPAPYIDGTGLPMSPNYSVQLTPPTSVTQTSPSQTFSIPGMINAFPLPGTQYPVPFEFRLSFSPEMSFGWPVPNGAISIACSQPFNDIPNIRYCAGAVIDSSPTSFSLSFTLPQMCIANTYQMFLVPDANPAHLQDFSRPVTCQGSSSSSPVGF